MLSPRPSSTSVAVQGHGQSRAALRQQATALTVSDVVERYIQDRIDDPEGVTAKVAADYRSLWRTRIRGTALGLKLVGGGSTRRQTMASSHGAPRP